MHTNLILLFKPILYYSTLVIKLLYVKILTVALQSSFISSVTHMASPLLKRKCSVLLVMYSWLNGFYCEISSKHSITLLFGSN